jgi:hypothetical protein
MEFIFKKEDIEQISRVLNAQSREHENNWTWQLNYPEEKQSLVMTVYNEIQLGKEIKGSMVSVQTLHGYFELHNCIGFVTFEPDEVIFVQSSGETVSCMIVGKQCTCSLFTNIRKEILKSDFNTLDTAVLLSAMQLSLTESLLTDN